MCVCVCARGCGGGVEIILCPDGCCNDAIRVQEDSRGCFVVFTWSRNGDNAAQPLTVRASALWH